MPDEPEPPSIDEIRRLMREWDRQLDELPSDPKELEEHAREYLRKKGVLRPRCPHCGKELP